MLFPSPIRRKVARRRVYWLALLGVVSLALITILSRGSLRPIGGESHSSSERRSSVILQPSGIKDLEQTSHATARAYGRLPLSFETNEGQANREVKFMSRGQGYGLFLTSSSAVLKLVRPLGIQSAGETERLDEGSESSAAGETVSLTMRFKGSKFVSHPVGLDELPGKSNYFIGNQAKNWRRSVSLYSKVRYQDIYPGISLVYYGNQRQLEYDLLVAPGVLPSRIRMVFEGMDRISVDPGGDLVLSTVAGDIRQPRPIAYQQVNGARREVVANYRIDGDGVGFEVGSYDKNLPLMIDPVLVYSSFLGGPGTEQGLGIAVDAQGSAYLTGSTTSTDFPLASALQGTKDAVSDAFVVKLNPAGTALVYSTYLGANGDDIGNAIAVDSQGNAYVTGLTGSGSFPTTPGVFQTSKDGATDGFLVKLSPSGSALVYSTFLGGDNSDSALGVAVDASNRAYVVGRTDSTRFNFIPLQRKGSPVYRSTNGAGNWSASASGLTASIVSCLTQDPVTAATIYAGTSIGVFKSVDSGATWSLTSPGSSQNAPLATNAVAIDPSNANIIYAATTNGIFKSINAGGTYSQKNSGLTNLSVFALVVDPSSPAILYAGTQAGVFKSTNGGDSWVGINNGTNSARVNKIVIDPTQNPATTIYLGTSSRGMLKTTNGGGVWTTINTGALSNFTPQVIALAIDPLNPLTLYVGVGPAPSVLFKTTDGGGTWSSSGTGLTFLAGGQPATPTVNTLAVDPVTTATVYATTSGGAIYKSLDGGANWNQSNTDFINTAATAIAIDRSNPANLYVGTTIGTDAFAVRLNSSGALDYLMSFGGDETDEVRGVAVESDGSAYIVGSTNSNNLTVTSAFQPTFGGLSDCFVAKLNSSGTAFSYLTYLGGNGFEQGRGIAVRAGSAYVTGSTNSHNFPLANAIKSTLADFDTDAFVTKLNSAGTSVDFSTYLGGENIDQGFGIAVDTAGDVYVTGATSSFLFPTLNAPQPILSNGNDAFVTKLDSAGTAITYSTYLGGVGNEQGNGIAVDPQGNAYVIGNTSSVDFPTASPLQSYRGGTDAFVTKLGPSMELAVAMTDSPDPVLFNSDLTYTLTVTNNGELPATGIGLTDTLPAGATFVSALPAQGSCAGTSTVTCSLGTLVGGANTVVTIVIKPPAVGTISNTANVTSNEVDPLPANNTATQSTQVLFADLSIENSSANDLAVAGSPIAYFLSARNNGVTTATSVKLVVNLPNGVTFVSCNASGGTCGGTGNSRTVAFAALAPGASTGAVIMASVNNSVAVGDVLVASATVSSSVPDPDPGNNVANSSVTVAAALLKAKLNGKIVFSTDGASTIKLRVVKADATGLLDLTSGQDYERRPAWSADGSKVAFQTLTFGSSSTTYDINVVNADGTGRIQLTNTAAIDARPTWSPNGKRIAFVGRDSSIYTISAGGGPALKLIDNSSPIRGLDWSPDGTKLAFENNGELYSVTLNGTQTKLTNHPGQNIDSNPRWSPNGARVLFTRSSDAWVVNSDGSGEGRLLNQGGGNFTWSPDGLRVAFELSGEINVMNVDGTGLLQLTNNNATPGIISYKFEPDWQPIPTNNPIEPPPPLNTFSISGHLPPNPFGTAVQLTGTRSASRVALPDGTFSFVNLPEGGDYTITPQSTLFGFTPTSRTFTNLRANQTAADFTSTPLSFSISGRVTDLSGSNIVGAEIRLMKNGVFLNTTNTDANGRYFFNNLTPGGDNGFPYIVIPTIDSTWLFNPSVASIILHSDAVADFVRYGRNSTVTISGRVMDGANPGVGISGALVRISDGQRTTLTDVSGNYSFSNIPVGFNQSIMVDTPANVLPKQVVFQPLFSNQTVYFVRYPASQLHTVSGRITDSQGNPLNFMGVTLAGPSTAQVATGADGSYSFTNVPEGPNYVITPYRGGGVSMSPAHTIIKNLSGDSSGNNFTMVSGDGGDVVFQFDSPLYTASEGDGSVLVTVTRVGSGRAATIDYTTTNGTALDRSDYTLTSGTLHFGVGETSKTFRVLLADDAYVENPETVFLVLSNPSSGSIGAQSVSTLTITDNDASPPAVNPLDTAQFFVRQHYHDFLNREPDASGLNFWSNEIDGCSPQPQCTEIKRINVSAAFFLSIEFQDTGYLVERIYKTAYGDANGTSTFGGTHQLPVPIIRLNEFLPDTQEIGQGVIVGQGNWQQQLEDNKNAFTADFVQRSRFTTAFPNWMTAAQFVDTLNTNAGNPLSTFERNQLVTDLSTNAKTRAQVLRAVAEDPDLNSAEFNRDFVLMQYFGYLRRNPNDPQDTDYTGYDFWLTKLNQFNGNFVNAEMVKAFISSGEYRQRFGP